MLGQSVAKWQKKDEVQKVKFKRVGFDDEGNMYYRVGQKKYVKNNKDVVEIVDSVPVEFVKVKELVKQVTPNLKN